MNTALTSHPEATASSPLGTDRVARKIDPLSSAVAHVTAPNLLTEAN